jgi:nicotinamidase-related amidase
MQTAIDLLASGFRVVLVADAVSSRDPQDRDLALARLRSEGATISSVESVLFEICRQAGTDQFKAISRLVK